MNGPGTPNGTLVARPVKWHSTGYQHSPQSAIDQSPLNDKGNSRNSTPKHPGHDYANNTTTPSRSHAYQGTNHTTNDAQNSPHPAPLHIIHSLVTQEPIRGHPRLSTHTWSASQMSGSFEAELEKGLDDSQDATSVCDDDEILVNEQVQKNLENYLSGWLYHAADRSEKDPIAEWVNNSEHQYCDVDTETGELLKRVRQPETIARDKAMDGVRDITFKQRTLTSKMHMEMALRLLDSKRPEPVLVSNSNAPDLKEVEWPTADCVVRPAREADLTAIARIANLEAQSPECPQIIQSQEITAAEMKRIFESCRNYLRPFVVAESKNVDDVLLDRKQWPAGADKAYLEYVRFKSSQPNKPIEVLGFAFVAESRIGFLNAPCPGSRHSGQVRLAIHPDHRQKGYGSALLDRVLQSISPYYRSLIDFDWQCTDDALIYESPTTYNRRTYARVYIESFSNADEKLADWRARMLEKFDFKQTGLFTKMVKTDRGGDSKWLDVAIWEHDTKYYADITDKAPGTWLKQ